MAAILPFGHPDDFMMDHPFWVVKVKRITKQSHTVQYFGGEFLGPYYPLHDGVRTTKTYVEKFKAGVLRFLHWDLKMTKPGKSHIGTIHKDDLAVLSAHKDVKWTLSDRTAEARATKPGSARVASKVPDKQYCSWCGISCVSEQALRAHQLTRSCLVPEPVEAYGTSNRRPGAPRGSRAQVDVPAKRAAPKRKAATTKGKRDKTAKICETVMEAF